MTAHLEPYPHMKESGVQWLGAVPEHWAVRRLGNLLRERGEVNVGGEIQAVLSVLKDRGVVPYAEKGNIGNKASEDITRYKVVHPGDIVMNCMNIIIGSVGLSAYTGCLSPVYYVLTRRSERDDPRYLNAYFQTKAFQRSLVRIGNGILPHRMRIPMELLKCEMFPRPPLSEQTAIVRYLDYVDQRVHRLLQAKRQLITLLTEQKQALIHHAVTRGLDPNVPLKDSGVEWLGQVPEHWEVLALKFASRIQVSGVNREIKKSEKCVRFLGTDTVYNVARITKDTSLESASANDADIENFSLRRGDVVVTKDSVAPTRIAIPAIVTDDLSGPTVCGYHLALLRPNTKLLISEYLFYALLSPSLSGHFLSLSKGTTIIGLSRNALGCALLPIPPCSEQTAIAEYLDQATANIDTAITRANREVALLTEYRTRLISDVVTGKLDVRKAAATLPDSAS